METIPSDANDGCVGPSSDSAGKVSGCAGCPNQSACASGANKSATNNDTLDMSQIKHKLLVLSGKGGVGKSTVSAQLAYSLASRGYQVGLLDIDICGPSIPRMLGLVGQEVHQSASGWSPVYVDDNLGVMSIGFMLPNNDDAVIWRGPKKNGLIKQFLSDVNWGPIDFLIIDTPPGTSDEHISIVQYLNADSIDGAIVVTTPQEVAMADVRKELNFCKKTGVTVLGVVENMSSLSTPLSSLRSGGSALKKRNGESLSSEQIESIFKRCPELLDLHLELPVFTTSSSSTSCPAKMAEQFHVPYLGRIPLDSNLMLACEQGKSFVETFPTSAATSYLTSIVDKVLVLLKEDKNKPGEIEHGL